MKKYRVTHSEAVWENATFDAEVPDDVPENEHEEWIRENIADLMFEAHTEGRLTLEIGGSSDALDCETTIREVWV